MAYAAHLRQVHVSKSKDMLIFVRHVFYCDLPTLLGPSLAASFTYINVLREPVARAASVLNWVHERSLAAARQPKPAGDAEWNTPLDHFPKVHDQYIRWHCGFTLYRSLVAGSLVNRLKLEVCNPFLLEVEP